jgi:branched-chain amino acid transport system substrate-binding protein
MRTVRILVLAVALAATGTSCSGSGAFVVGAVYPTGGGQGPGAIEEYRGVQLAAELANERGGVRGRPVELELEQADSADAAPGAVDRLAERDVQLIVGSYGSTISRPAANAASRHNIVFWETGAVGEIGMAAAPGEWMFRFPATGGVLGRQAVGFLRTQQLGPRAARYAVTYVDDVYGRSVGLGAIDEIRRAKLPLVATLPYKLDWADYGSIARRVKASGADVLVVAAYIDDGIALRRAVLKERVPLKAMIGTSSSYCMPAFGEALGEGAVGVFASDKPDEEVLEEATLSGQGAETLRAARRAYRERYDEPMSAAALTGFSAAWALFRYVLPRAKTLTSGAIADVARTIRVPKGTLPDGAGLEFAPADAPDAGGNRRAASVIEQWTKPRTRAVVWPDDFATQAVSLDAASSP